MNIVETVRVRFTKTGRARYISHLDLMRTMTRVLRRAQIPLWYTEGFNRHPYITFAAPLSLGYEGLCEYMDFRLEQEMPMEEIVTRLNVCMPQGVVVLSAAPAKQKVNAIAASRWQMVLDCPADIIKALLGQETIAVQKRTKKGGVKTLDIKPDLSDVSITEKNNSCELTVTLPMTSEHSLNPSLLLTALEAANGGESVGCAVTRLSVLTADGKIFE